jgi:hypothetical protein
MGVGRSGDAMTLGQFELVVDWKQGLASHRFFKKEVKKGLPLAPEDLSARIRPVVAAMTRQIGSIVRQIEATDDRPIAGGGLPARFISAGFS